jgi:formyl-CoA transferase
VEIETSPLLGQHNSEIYGGLGIADSELDELRAAGVI